MAVDCRFSLHVMSELGDARPPARPADAHYTFYAAFRHGDVLHTHE